MNARSAAINFLCEALPAFAPPKVRKMITSVIVPMAITMEPTIVTRISAR